MEMMIDTRGETKSCSSCGQSKLQTEYHANKRNPDGLTSKCKECHNLASRIWRAGNKVTARDYKRKQRNTDHGKLIKSDIRRRRRHKNNASNRLRRAVASGKIIKPGSCSNCGRPCSPEGHHEDYGKPLDVVWLCPRCHTDVHYPNNVQAIIPHTPAPQNLPDDFDWRDSLVMVRGK